jgi:transmembrane sensor
LRRAVKADVSEARLARQWERIAVRLETPRAKSRWPALALGVAVIGVIAALLWVRDGRDGASPWDGAVLETRDSGMAVALNDGSRIEIEPHTRLSVQTSPQRTELALAGVGASFDVAHGKDRRFHVSLGGVQVRVIGTRFSVREVQAPSGSRQVEVKVTRGTVEASAGAGGGSVRLSAGQTWSAPSTSPMKRTAKRAEPSPPSSAPVAEKARATERAPVAAAPAHGPSVRPEAPGPAEVEKANAKQLFEAANRARAAGDAPGAAQNYRRLLDEYPRDSRAPLAAFELGRLQMDRLGQPAQAISSLKRALASSSGGGFREDAMARLVAAYAATGARAACARARTAYLKQYPNGVHRTTVQAQCGAPGLP